MKIRAKFSKKGMIRFVGHLDFMRHFQRIVKMAKLPVAYSQGFNPHALLYFALPIPVGMESMGDYLELVLTEDMPVQEIKDRLNSVLNNDIRIIDVYEIEDKSPTLMSLVEAADYEIKLYGYDTNDLNSKILESALNQESLMVIKKGKKGDKEVDIKPLILGYELDEVGKNIIIALKCYAGSSSNLNPDLFLKAITNGADYQAKTSRKEMYTTFNDELVPISAVRK